MSEWIKARITLHQDPIVVKQAAALGRTAYEIAYAWIVVWGWARSHTADGFVRDVDHATIDAIAGIPGFAQNAGRWVEIASDGVTFPNWDRHNSNGARERAQANERMSKIRAGKSRGDGSALRLGDDSVALERNTSATRREEKRDRVEITTTTTNSVIARAEEPTADENLGGGGDGISQPSSVEFVEAEIAKASDSIPRYIAAAHRIKNAINACRLAETFGGTGADVVEFAAAMAQSSSEKARPGTFVNLLRSEVSAFDKHAYAAFLAGQPVRKTLAWLCNTVEGRAAWARAYTLDIKQKYSSEEAARKAFAQHLVEKNERQAQGGAA